MTESEESGGAVGERMKKRKAKRETGLEDSYDARACHNLQAGPSMAPAGGVGDRCQGPAPPWAE